MSDVAGLKNWLKTRFVAGFFVTVPAIATAYILWIFWSWVDAKFAPIYGQILGRPVEGWGLGFLTAMAIILLRSEEHTSELQSQSNLVCRLLLEKKRR